MLLDVAPLPSAIRAVSDEHPEPRRSVLHEQGALANAAHNPQLAQSVLGDLLHGFFVLTAWVLGVALVVLVIAVLSGAVSMGSGHPLVGDADRAQHRGGTEW